MDDDERTNAELADAAAMADDPEDTVTQGVTYGVVNKTSSHMDVESVPNDEPVDESPPRTLSDVDVKTASTPEQMDEQTTDQTGEQTSGGGDAEPIHDGENGEISVDKRRADSASSAVTIQTGKLLFI